MRSVHLAQIGLVLAVTVAVKVAFGPSMAAAVNNADRDAPVADFLTRQGFALEPSPVHTEPVMLIASRADCELRITEVSPFGWHRHVIAQLARPGEQSAFVYNGSIFRAQPIWRTAISHNLRRLVAYAGISMPRNPVLGLVASQKCQIDQLPWAELAKLS